jgi:hypothetical protein
MSAIRKRRSESQVETTNNLPYAPSPSRSVGSTVLVETFSSGPTTCFVPAAMADLPSSNLFEIRAGYLSELHTLSKQLASPEGYITSLTLESSRYFLGL